MNRQEIEDHISRQFIEHFKPERPFHPQLERQDLPDWSSLNHVLFFIRLEKSLGLKFTGEELIGATRVDRIFDLVERKLHETP